LVVGENRAALDFGPSALAGEPLDSLFAARRIPETGRPRIDVVGCDVPQLQAHRAAFGL
jgi:hypothetical protein